MTEETAGAAPGGMPEPSFTSLAQLLFFPGMIATGKMADPATGETRPNIDLARFHVGLLETLKEKTEGNRTPDEEELVEQMLHALRLAFVDATGGEQG